MKPCKYIKLDALIDFDRELSDDDLDEFIHKFMDFVEDCGAVCFAYHKLESDEYD